MRNNYVCAGFETVAGILDRFIKGPEYNHNFTRSDINRFFGNTCNKFLHSYGQYFREARKYHKYSKKENELFVKCRSFGFFDDSEFFVDSGGFQISVGILDKVKTDLLFNMYYEFLAEYIDSYNRAFILDVPPGPNCKVFSDFDDVYKMNYESYTKAANLPSNVRDKIIYVHHFRTPKLWEIYSKILHDDGLFKYFNYHATGGIVANQSSDMDIPCIIYVIPLIPLVNEALKNKRTTLHFHILGGSNFREILFYELFKLHMMKKHNLNLEITYDSSGLFKGLMRGRYVYIMDGDAIKKVDIRTSSLSLRYRNEDKKINEKYLETLNEFAYRFGFSQLSRSDVYCGNSGTFHTDIKIYTMLYSLSMYSTVQDKMRSIVGDLYSLYESGELEEFNNKAELITRNINNEKITRKQQNKTYSIVRSLDMLSNLDEDYCKHIVEKFLAKDEFIELLNGHNKIMRW